MSSTPTFISHPGTELDPINWEEENQSPVISSQEEGTNSNLLPIVTIPLPNFFFF